MAPNTDEKGAAELGREALAQFRDAARYGAKALAERKAARGVSALKDRAPSIKDRSPEKEESTSSSIKDNLPIPTADGGAASELGELADAALARFGKKGKLASKIGVGHRLVNRLLPEPEEEADEEDKVEFALKGLYDEEAILRELVTHNREIGYLRNEIAGKSEAATYYERIRLGELIAAAFATSQEVDETKLVEELGPHAVAVRVGEPIHERMAINVSFLVERSGQSKFDRAVDAIGAREAGRIRFKVTGPLPPHSFVELEAVV